MSICQSRHKDAYKKCPGTILSSHQETYQQFYIQGGGESGEGLRLEIRSKWSKTLGCSTFGCLSFCNGVRQLVDWLAAAIGNNAKMCWSKSLLCECFVLLSLLLCLLCFDGESGFFSFVKYCQMGKFLFAASFFARFLLLQIPIFQCRTHCCFFFNVCWSIWSSIKGKYLSHS